VAQVNASSLASQLLKALSQQSATQGQQQSSIVGTATNPANTTATPINRLVQLSNGVGNAASVNVSSPSTAISQYTSLPSTTTTSVTPTSATSTGGSTTNTAGSATNVISNVVGSLNATTNATDSDGAVSQYQTLTSAQETQIQSSSMYATLTDANGNPVTDADGNSSYDNAAKVQYLQEYIAQVDQGASAGSGGLTQGGQQEVTAAQNLISYLNSNTGNDVQVQQALQVLTGQANEQINTQSIFQNASAEFMGNDPDDDMSQVEDDLDKSTQAMNAAVNGLNDDDDGSGDD
jgi:hypothetical protein